MFIYSIFTLIGNYFSSKNPIIIVGFALITIRSSSFLLNQLTLESIPPFQLMILSLLYFIGEAILLTGFLLIFWKLIPKLRVLVNFLACIGIPMLIFLGLIDIFLFSITGDHLTPSLLRQFSGVKIFTSSHFIEPVKSNFLAIGIALIIVFVSFGIFIRLFWKRGRDPQKTPLQLITVLRWNLIGIVVLSIPLLMGSYNQIDRPVEVLYMEELLGADGVELSSSEKESISALREFVGLPHGREWINDRYPLVHGAINSETKQHNKTNSLDIFVIVIESLRAQCLDYITVKHDGCKTPNLSILAKESVVLPQYISNGFPSGPGFITMSGSTWPHHKKRIVPDFQTINFDGLAPRLNSIGYETIVIDGDANFDMQSHWNKKLFSTVIDLKTMGLDKSEKTIFSEAKKEISKLDKKAERPIYMQIKTSNPHLPYQTPNDETGEMQSGNSLPVNYINSMEYVDRHIGNFIAFLKNRERINNSIIVITGDHSNYLNQSKISPLPYNDTVWTSALIYGPQNKVGKPRRIESPASHVDLNPTLLALVGDKRPTASLGRNLLEKSDNVEPFAFAIRPGGVRFDRNGYSFILDHKSPNSIITQPAFPALKPSQNKMQDRDKLNTQLKQINSVFSYLLENNRLWNPELLKASL